MLQRSIEGLVIMRSNNAEAHHYTTFYKSNYSWRNPLRNDTIHGSVKASVQRLPALITGRPNLCKRLIFMANNRQEQ